MNDWHLYNQFENGKQTGRGAIASVQLFSIVAWIILLIACINFMNLATARSEKRAREVGVRKVLGAGRSSLIARFMGEAMFMAFLAAIVAVMIIMVCLPSFNMLVQKNLSIGFANMHHLLFLLGIVLVCGLVAGSYPSFYLSSFNPAAVLKGLRLKAGSATVIRKSLVVLQFSISMILIISTIIVYQQINHVKDRKLGFNKENLKVQQKLLQNNIQQKQRTQTLVDAGSIPRGDLLDMSATVATSQQSVIMAENTLLISKLSLAQLLQLEDFKNFDVVESEIPLSENAVMLQSADAIYNKAKEERVELKIARANLEIAQKDIEIAKSGLQPTLRGFYSFSSRATNSDRISTDANGNFIVRGPDALFNQFSDNKGNAFGLQLNIPILNGFSVKNNIERSKIAFKRSEIAINQQELDLKRNVYTAFTDANGALNAYEAAVTALEARAESYKYAQQRFEVGLLNAFDLNQSQTLFANAESEVIRA
ncbi:MAG: FtsX-like permease family protein, partial [Sphingobacteriales bacterium]